jgi:hypothetical protein
MPAEKGLDPGGFTGRCVAAVLRLGRASAAQVAAEVGAEIPASRAVTLGRARVLRSSRDPRQSGSRRGRARPDSPTYTVRRLAEIGRLAKVASALRGAYRRGHLKRLAPGVYGPPAPRIYAGPAEAG